jgi:hypothetical protein
MACKAWPIKLYPTLHLSPVKCTVKRKAAEFTKMCTVKRKAAEFTRIRVCEELNVGMMQVKPAASDYRV